MLAKFVNPNTAKSPVVVALPFTIKPVEVTTPLIFNPLFESVKRFRFPDTPILFPDI